MCVSPLAGVGCNVSVTPDGPGRHLRPAAEMPGRSLCPAEICRASASIALRRGLIDASAEPGAALRLRSALRINRALLEQHVPLVEMRDDQRRDDAVQPMDIV